MRGNAHRARVARAGRPPWPACGGTPAPWPVAAALIACLAATPCRAAEVGDPVPECAAAAGLQGEAGAAAGLQGRVVLVDFWATWCAPCRKAMPFLNRLRNELHGRGFEVVAINVGEDPEEARRYLATRPVDYPVRFDPKGDCPGAFGVKAMPSSYLVGKDGRIRAVHRGFREGDQASLRQRVDALLAE